MSPNIYTDYSTKRHDDYNGRLVVQHLIFSINDSHVCMLHYMMESNEYVLCPSLSLVNLLVKKVAFDIRSERPCESFPGN